MKLKVKNCKQEVATNLKKAASLLNKIVKMAENDEYCIAIMQQNLAMIGLLKAANQKLMVGHLNSCFRNAMASSSSTRKKKMINEILQVTKLSK